MRTKHPSRWQHCIAFAAALALALLTGCAATPASSSPAPVAADDYRRTFEAAIETLRVEGFVVARQDFRFGRITSQPRPSPAFFEVWKRDNSTAGQALGSTVNADDRVVTVKFDPANTSVQPALQLPDGVPLVTAESDATLLAIQAGREPSAPYTLAVEVAIHRHQRPARRLTGSTDGSHLVRPLLDVPDDLDKRGATPDYRTFVENDEPMASKLLALILQRASQPALADAGE